MAQIGDWWRRWPKALIGLPTGRITGFVALDVDVRVAVNGFDTLADIGVAVLPNTPMVHTPSGGLHLYFRPPERTEIRNTAGGRGSGIGLGLDWRGEGGYVIAPSPGSGYCWDPHWNLDTAALAPIPALLLPRVPECPRVNAAVARAAGLSPFAETALDSACRCIIEAPDGQQEQTLNGESFAIGTLAGANAIPADFALRALIWASRKIRDYDHRRPWRAAEIEAKVNRAFHDGTRQPRRARGG
jgi:putative DNA primase/helicase